LGDLDPEALYEAMFTDKKWQRGQSRFVLLKRIGEAAVVTDVPAERVIEVLQTIR
jgi:3-dehydroquinate synthetase